MIGRTGELPPLVVFQADFEALSILASLHSSLPVAQFLGEELNRASVVTRTKRKFVRLGSRVRYQDLSKTTPTEITLVMPNEADLKRRFVSVLTAVGAALIGLKEGQSITFSMPWTGPRTIVVLQIADDSVEES